MISIPIELRKLKTSLAQVYAARLVMELNIAEREVEIARVQKNIDVQLAAEADLQKQIDDLEKQLSK